MEGNRNARSLGLAIPTYGRFNELHQLLASISNQPNIPEQIAIIDQNEVGFLDSLIAEWSDHLPIDHHRVNFKSASKARNLGAKILQTDIIAFPDDDCIFLNDTAGKIKDAFQENPSADIIIGKKKEFKKHARTKKKRTTKTIKSVLDLFNAKAETSNIFCKRTALLSMPMLFDESVGPGDCTEVISNEETDLLIRMLHNNANLILYCGIEIHHHSSQVSFSRSLKYGEGRFELIKRRRLGIFYYLLNLVQPIIRLATKPSLIGIKYCAATLIGRSGITRLITTISKP